MLYKGYVQKESMKIEFMMSPLKLLCLCFCMLLWVALPARAELSELESESWVENSCNLPDGVYEAHARDGNRIHLVLESNKIVSMYALVKTGIPIVAMFTEWFSPAEYEAIHFKRSMAGCHGDRWFYAWESSSSAPVQQASSEDSKDLPQLTHEGGDKNPVSDDAALHVESTTSRALAPVRQRMDLELISNQSIQKKTYFQSHGGIVEGKLSPDNVSLILNRVEGLNNFSAILGDMSESRCLDFTYSAVETADSGLQEATDEMVTSKTVELARRQCRVPMGDYQFQFDDMDDGWSYTLKLGAETELFREWDGWLEDQAHAYTSIRVICDGDHLLVDFPDQDRIERAKTAYYGVSEHFDPRVTFLGVYDPIKETISSLCGDIRLSQPERKMKIGKYTKIDRFSSLIERTE